MDTEQTRRETWMRRAEQLRARVNMGWWWNAYLRFAITGSAATAAGLLWLRMAERPLETMAAGWGLWMLITAWAVLRRVRRRFLSLEGALARLDASMGFHNRLVSAWEGACGWPRAEETLPLPVVWKPATLGVPVLLSFCFLGMGVWLPLPARDVPPVIVRSEPPEWKALETLAEELRQRDVVDETALETVEQQVAELRAKAPETWYRPGSMEATGQLRQQVRNDAMTLQQALRETGSLLASAAQQPPDADEERREAMREMFQDMLAQLGEGGMPLNAAQLQQLAQMDPAALAGLNAEQLQQLMDQLQAQADALGEALAAAGMEGEMEGDGGGVGRGGGPSPLSLKDTASALEPAVPLALNNPDPGRAAMGDLLDVQKREHDEAPSTAGSAGGRVAEGGGSGEVVWKSDVLPAEQSILKAYFK